MPSLQLYNGVLMLWTLYELGPTLRFWEYTEEIQVRRGVGDWGVNKNSPEIIPKCIHSVKREPAKADNDVLLIE